MMARDGHLSTGFIGTKDLMLALAKIGRNAVAYLLSAAINSFSFVMIAAWSAVSSRG
ncbi:MAG: hypothetical protein HZC54_19775 [Verrucomicrobia bacterium]|nr:hypothetical protein [Verrucomicrobiota bacterium]